MANTNKQKGVVVDIVVGGGGGWKNLSPKVLRSFYEFP